MRYACVFYELLMEVVLILYMDDLVIPTKTEAEGPHNWKRDLQTVSDLRIRDKL